MPTDMQKDLAALCGDILARTQDFASALNRKLGAVGIDTHPSEHVIVRSLIDGLGEVAAMANVGVSQMSEPTPDSLV